MNICSEIEDTIDFVCVSGHCCSMGEQFYLTQNLERLVRFLNRKPLPEIATAYRQMKRKLKQN